MKRVAQATGVSVHRITWRCTLRVRGVTGGLIGLFLCVAAVPAATAQSATAFKATGGPRWGLLTNVDQESTATIGLARTGDGVLHIVWPTHTGGLFHTAIAPDGRVGRPIAVTTGWSAMGDAALINAPGAGLETFFAGTHSTNVDDLNNGLNLATSSDGGTTWNVSPESVGWDDYAASRTPTVALAADGTPLETWYGVDQVVVHRGLSPFDMGTEEDQDEDEDQPYSQASGGACCNNLSNIATDPSTGQTLVVWCAFNAAPNGLWVQNAVGSTGAPNPAGPVRLPGSTTVVDGRDTRSCDATGRTPFAIGTVGRPPYGNGAFVADPVGYPIADQVVLWNLGGARVVIADAPVDHRTVALAAAPGGRVWVAWTQEGPDGPVLFARRSSVVSVRPGFTEQFGAPVRIDTPSGTSSVSALDASAQAGALDLIARLTDGQGNTSLQHIQLLPGLTLHGLAAHLPQRRALLHLRILDAGTPIHGAHILISTRHQHVIARGTANQSGRTTITLPTSRKPHALTVRVTAPGYTTTSRLVRQR